MKIASKYLCYQLAGSARLADHLYNYLILILLAMLSCLLGIQYPCSMSSTTLAFSRHFLEWPLNSAGLISSKECLPALECSAIKQAELIDQSYFD